MKKISARLWIQMLLLIGITLALLWVFQVEMLDRYYIYSQTNNIKKQGSEIVDLLNQGTSIRELEGQIEEFNLRYNSNVEIYSANGKRLYGYDFGPRMMGMAMDKQQIFGEVMEGNTVVRQVQHNRFNTNILFVGLPVGKPGEITGVFMVSAALASVKEATSIIKEQLMIVTAILVFISLFLTYFFSRAFTKPILLINEAADKMAKGNLSVKVEVNSRDELGMLADTINNLSVQLQKIEQLRKELIANVSHEFRTPLSLIKGYAETIRDVSGGIAEKRNKQLEIILEETDRLKNMVDDTLNLSQMQSQNFELNQGSFDIVSTIKNVMNRFLYIQEKSGVKLEMEVDGEVLVVNGDESRIEQVLYNLVNNAFNHTQRGGLVAVRAAHDGKTVKVEVEDNGEGIPEKDLPFIWDRFYKVSGKEGEESKGTGLGLAIAKSILEAHGSRYGVESKLGEGTKFWFTLNRTE